MTTLVTRAGKGTALSWSEVDANFNNLSADIGTLDTTKLAVTTAASTYETQTHAASTYAPITTTVTKDSATGAINTTNGTTAERPSNAVAKVRYNSTLDSYEGYTTFYGWDGLANGPELKLGRSATAADNVKLVSGTASTPLTIKDGADTTLVTVGASTTTFVGALRASGISNDIYPRYYKATTSVGTGTEIEFTSIPSWVTKITMLFSDISSTSTGNLQVQVANSGTYVTTGYNGSVTQIAGATPATTVLSVSFTITTTTTAASVISGRLVLDRMFASGDTWVASGTSGFSSGANTTIVSGSISSIVLDKVKLKLSLGNFDGGTVSLWYE